MNNVEAPKAPDPVATAQEQKGLNLDTALTQQGVNKTNQVGPNGSLTYSQTGSNTFTGSDGKPITIPQFTATTALSPTGTKINDTNLQTQLNLAGIGRDQSAKIGGILGTNVNLSNDAVEGRLMDLGSKRLDPILARNENALRTRLTNQGIMPGSDAWNAEMTQFGQGRNDAYNQLLLSGRGQSIQEILTERNQPLNEISALLSGSQVAQPSFLNTPQAQVGGVDYGGMVNNSFNGQLASAKMQNDSNNAMMGGLFGLAGAGVKAGTSPFKPFWM